jgi:hypothetical protein
MNTQKSVFKKISHIKKEESVELSEQQRVELALVDDIKARMKQIISNQEIAEEVIKAADNVNTAINKVVDDARYYKKFKTIVFGNLRADANQLFKEIQKLESDAKELGIDLKSIPEIDLANRVRNDAMDTLSLLDRVNLEFDI